MSLFGTDGVRGVANADLTPELAFAIGRAGAAILCARAERERPIVIGRDTRLSGTMLEAAVAAGIASTGRDAVALDVVPTPGVARVTSLLGAAAGVMISASHNPIEDNGIKFFGADGFKLSDEQEAAIEAALAGADAFPRPTHDDTSTISWRSVRISPGSRSSSTPHTVPRMRWVRARYGSSARRSRRSMRKTTALESTSRAGRRISGPSPSAYARERESDRTNTCWASPSTGTPTARSSSTRRAPSSTATA
jgi:hypothetical protein